MASGGDSYSTHLCAYALSNPLQNDAEGAGSALPVLGHAVAGSIATAASKVLLYPLDLVITRLQVQRQLHGPREAYSAAQDADAEYASLIDAAQKIYALEGGLTAFYTGCLPDVGKGIADSFLFFLAYTFIRQRELRKHGGGKSLPVSRELAVGVVAGAFAKIITTPIQNIITRQQTAAMVSARDPASSTTPASNDNLTMKDIALQIRSERGIRGFWAGYSASMILTLNPAITFAVDNLLRRLLPRRSREKPSGQLTFLIAATSKALATTLTYPISLTKSRAQISGPSRVAEKEGTGSNVERPSVHSKPARKRLEQNLHKALRLLLAQYAIFVSLRRIYREEGISGLYSGLEGEVLKGFLSHGLTMVMKDRVLVGVIRIYYALLSLVGRSTGGLENVSEKAGGLAGKATNQAGDAVCNAQSHAGAAVEAARGKAENLGEQVVEGGKKIVEEIKRRALNLYGNK